MSAFPRMLVLMCTHDGLPHLTQQLDSLAAQSRPPVGLVVHDWGSSDGTPAVLERTARNWGTTLPMQLHRHAAAPGAAESFRFALGALLEDRHDFDVLLLCDQDDVWRRDKLAVLSGAFAEDPGLDLACSDLALIDAEGRTLAASYIGAEGVFAKAPDLGDPVSMLVNVLPGMSLAISRAWLQRARPVWSAGPVVMHDWALLVAAHLGAARWRFVPQALVAYRQHGANVLGAQAPGGASRGAQAWRRWRAHARVVHAQWLGLAAAAAACGWRPPPVPGRLGVAWRVARRAPLRPFRRLAAALAYALCWPGRRP